MHFTCQKFRRPEHSRADPTQVPITPVFEICLPDARRNGRVLGRPQSEQLCRIRRHTSLQWSACSANIPAAADGLVDKRPQMAETVTMSQWNPNDYHQHSSQQQKWARDILDRLALAGHEQILDIGCGDGKITAEVARCVPNGFVVGLGYPAGC